MVSRSFRINPMKDHVAGVDRELSGVVSLCGRFVKTGELDCSLEDRRNMSGQLSMNVGRWLGKGPQYVSP